jgi:ribosomal-protein-alanine N-acetyltransferase
MLVTRITAAEYAGIEPIARDTGCSYDIRVELARPYTVVWAARPAGDADPTAFLLAWQVADELHVLHVGTTPAFRRRGAGRALFGALLEHARSQRTRLVLLEVRRSNRAAICLYRSCGFYAARLRPAYYADTAEDAIEMALTLDPITGQLVATRDEVTLDFTSEDP